MRENAYAYPALETLHILGLGLLFGSIVAFDLRILGWNADLPARRLAKLLLPWVWTGFIVNAASGALLFMSDAVEFAANPALQAKLALIVVAGFNAAAFQFGAFPSVAAWDRGGSAPLSAKVSAVASLLLWVAIVTAGRMIAYVK